ncbi:hypothetical protein BCI9360_03647 [Bacillus sp. CECT 9360]|nr:hypothetical protein BCI9360_03647 [Bacillus sp. CECT 9360]
MKRLIVAGLAVFLLAISSQVQASATESEPTPLYDLPNQH